MDMVSNPYTPSAGRRPPELVGRDQELDAMWVLVERARRKTAGRSMVLHGLRGVGKTVLLHELHAMADAAGWLTAEIEGSRHVGAKARARATLGRDVAAGGRRLRGRGAAASEKLKNALAALLGTQHRATQRDIPFYVVGAGLPNLPSVLAASNSYAERQFDYRATDAERRFMRALAADNGRTSTVSDVMTRIGMPGSSAGTYRKGLLTKGVDQLSRPQRTRLHRPSHGRLHQPAHRRLTTVASHLPHHRFGTKPPVPSP
jgi:hypothetical protein